MGLHSLRWQAGCPAAEEVAEVGCLPDSLVAREDYSARGPMGGCRGEGDSRDEGPDDGMQGDSNVEDRCEAAALPVPWFRGQRAVSGSWVYDAVADR